ncbi:uncharacterized protein LOC125523073 [Triticum urartu]|uniref:uncharacterized protein LOC125523073 n=1 Tax=Triticum urartu TaxID=4572 RepID=UPI0020447890|nr:uncharacterized protein LOC125523073 [Triticum urartu]
MQLLEVRSNAWMRLLEEQRWWTGSWQQRLQRAAAAVCGGAAAADGRSACHRSGYGGSHEQGSTTFGPSKPTTTASLPASTSFSCCGVIAIQELGRMVFTEKKNLLKGWMCVVRGHELVPGIQKGAHAMELREHGEPCVPPGAMLLILFPVRIGRPMGFLSHFLDLG